MYSRHCYSSSIMMQNDKGYYHLISSRVQRSENAFRHSDAAFRIPLKSKRVENSSYILLGSNSQRQLRRCFDGEVSRRFCTVEKLFSARLIKIMFGKWKQHYPRAIGTSNKPTKRCFYPILKCDIPYEQIVRNGMKNLWVWLYHFYIRLLRISFWKFKQRCYDQICWVRRFFLKWQLKTSLLKINRMNGIRYLKLMKTFAVKVLWLKLQSHFLYWKKSTELRKSLIMVGLIFRCWKLTSIASKKLRIHRLKEAIQALENHRKLWLLFWSTKVTKVQEILSSRLAKKVFGLWFTSLKKKLWIGRFVSMLIRFQMLKCWNTWNDGFRRRILPAVKVCAEPKMIEKALALTPTVTPIKDITVSRSSFCARNSSGRRYCASPFCSHADLYCSTGGSSPPRYSASIIKLPSSARKALSLQEKAKIRMKVLKDMDEEYTERESFRLSNSSQSSLWSNR